MLETSKLATIDKQYDSAQASLIVGAKRRWGRGYALAIILWITQYGFNDLNLFRLEAGCYEDNSGSLRAFLKSGFVIEGFFQKIRYRMQMDRLFLA